MFSEMSNCVTRKFKKILTYISRKYKKNNIYFLYRNITKMLLLNITHLLYLYHHKQKGEIMKIEYTTKKDLIKQIEEKGFKPLSMNATIQDMKTYLTALNVEATLKKVVK